MRFCDDAFSRLSRLSGVVAPVFGVGASKLFCDAFGDVDILIDNVDFFSVYCLTVRLNGISSRRSKPCSASAGHA